MEGCVGLLDPGLAEQEEIEYSQQGLTIYRNLEEVISVRPDIVVEVANQTVAKMCVPRLLESGLKVVSLSVGAYLESGFMEQLSKYTKIGRTGKLIIPSGALPGVDVIKAAKIKSIEEVELITRKPPRALVGAPGLDKMGVNPAGLTEPLVIFQGTAQEAVVQFPSNINIAATLSLAGLGAVKTKVTIIADPGVTVNIHQLKVKGDFGRYEAILECEPSQNPKTSLIAALSAVALLYNMASPISIGT